jgi:deazaflavin-dependent oxidoreductase (nitroreductase family)
MTKPATPRHNPRWQQALQRLFATRYVASFVLHPLAHHLDTWMLRLTRGRHSLTGLLTGLEVIQMTTTGAKSGLPRQVTLLSNRDGEKYVLVATNFGKAHHPAWYYNLRAHPEVSVGINGRQQAYRARQVELEHADYERYWQQTIQLYAGYAAYRERITMRNVPIFVLEPIPADIVEVQSAGMGNSLEKQ